MSLIWADPFDQYGNNFALVPGFGYSSASGGFTTPGRTGTYAYYCNNTNRYLQRSLDVAEPTLGSGASFRPLSQSGDGSGNPGFHFRDGANAMMDFVSQADNSIGIYDRTGTKVGTTPPNMLSTNNDVWVECKVTANSAGVGTGKAEVRIQGIQKALVNNVNVPNPCTSVCLGHLGFSNLGNQVFDDWIIWNIAGAVNNTFMGDRRLFYSLTSANRATQDFTPSAGNAWSCLRTNPPVAGTYVEGTAAGNVSEFDKDALGIAANDIAAAVMLGFLYKTDAGTAAGRFGINSNGSVVNSQELFPGTSTPGQGFMQIQELDPNGNIPWTQAAYNLAGIRLTRSQ